MFGLFWVLSFKPDSKKDMERVRRKQRWKWRRRKAFHFSLQDSKFGYQKRTWEFERNRERRHIWPMCKAKKSHGTLFWCDRQQKQSHSIRLGVVRMCLWTSSSVWGHMLSLPMFKEGIFFSVGIDEWLRDDVHGGLFFFLFLSVWDRQTCHFTSLRPLFFFLSTPSPFLFSFVLCLDIKTKTKDFFSLFSFRLSMIEWSSDLGRVCFHLQEVGVGCFQPAYWSGV